MSAGEQPVRVARLRCARTRRWRVGQRIAVEHGHFFEMRSDRLRRRETRHSGANDDCVLQDWVAHFGYLHGQARLTPFGRVSSPLAETSHDAWRLGGGEITNLRSYRRRNPSVLTPNLSRCSPPHSDGDHTAVPNNRGDSTQLRECHHMLRTPKSRKAQRKLREMSAQTMGKPILIEDVDRGEGGRDVASRA